VVSQKNEFAQIKSELTQRKMELEEKLQELSRERITDDQVQDPGDQALSSTMESLRTSLQTAETEEYKRIVRALEKIEMGTYGICIDCNQPISEKRLKSYPDAARCLICQELFEDKEKE
jgi:DnaK suppressor protein